MLEYGLLTSAIKPLKAIDYDRTITFEVFKSTKAAAKSRDLLIKLWSKG